MQIWGISNGCPKDLRPLINRVFGVLAYGAGLDAVILDAKDTELIRIFKMIENKQPSSSVDKLYIKLAQMINSFQDLEEIEYDTNNVEECNIIKTATVLLNKKIYSDSFTQV